MSVYGERRGQATEISSPNIFVGRHIFLDHCVAEKKNDKFAGASVGFRRKNRWTSPW